VEQISEPKRLFCIASISEEGVMDTGTPRYWGIFLLLGVLVALAGCGRSDMTTAAPAIAPPIAAATAADCGWYWTGGPEVLPVKEALGRALTAAGLNGRVSTFTYGESNCVKFDAETFDARINIEVDANTITQEARLAQIAAQLQRMTNEASQQTPGPGLNHTMIWFASPTQECMWSPDVPHCKLYPREL
jgi:hypothetical protein